MTARTTSAESDESLQLRAYHALRTKIIDVDYAPGDKLLVHRLCDELGMGRTPVRESLVRLSQEGLVHTVPQSGTYVSSISLRLVEDARYMREQVERNVYAQCCSMRTDDDLAQLGQLIHEQELARQAGDAAAFYTKDNLFHEHAYRLARRSQVWAWLNLISADYLRYRRLRMRAQGIDWDTIIAQHTAIVEAIAQRDAAGAGLLASQHIHLLYDEVDEVVAAFPAYFADDREQRA